MTNREKNLLNVLIFIIIALFFYFTFQYSIVGIKDTNKSIARYTEMINTVKASHNKSEKTKSNNENYTKLDGSSINEVADIILKELKQANIVPYRYQLLNDGHSYYVEASIRCSNSQFSNYLFQFNEDAVYPYYINYINVINENNRLNINIKYFIEMTRILTDNGIEKYTLTRLFRPKDSEVVLNNDESTKEIKEENIKLPSEEYTVIGYLKDNKNKEYLFLKKKDSSKVVKIGSEDIISDSGDKLLVKIGKEQILINKGK